MKIARRRWFFYAAAAFAMAGFGILSVVRRPEPDLITSTCTGADPRPRKILVTCATRTGSTAEMAEVIARRLCDAALDGHEGGVLASAIRLATWLPKMAGYLETNRQRIAEMPVAFFTMHMLALENHPAAVAERQEYTAKAREIIAPFDEAFFDGMIDPSRLSFLDRLAVRRVKSPMGDRRNRPRIEAWATALAPRLMA